MTPPPPGPADAALDYHSRHDDPTRVVESLTEPTTMYEWYANGDIYRRSGRNRREFSWCKLNSRAEVRFGDVSLFVAVAPPAALQVRQGDAERARDFSLAVAAMRGVVAPPPAPARGEALTAEVERLRLDAARLDWLHRHAEFCLFRTDSEFNPVTCEVVVDGRYSIVRNGASAREAIDNAMVRENTDPDSEPPCA